MTASWKNPQSLKSTRTGVDIAWSSIPEGEGKPTQAKDSASTLQCDSEDGCNFRYLGKMPEVRVSLVQAGSPRLDLIDGRAIGKCKMGLSYPPYWVLIVVTGAGEVCCRSRVLR